MTISQLTYVLALAKYKNFTVAANHCAVTQPTLSMQIQKLENELGTLIFNRKKKPLELTDIGQKIVNQAKKIVDESHRITDIIEQEKGYIGGEFTIGIIPTVMPTLLPLFLKTFTKRYPKIKLTIQELTTNEMVKKLTNGQLDVGIAATPIENTNIKERVLYYEPFVGFIPPYHKLHPQKKISVDDLDINTILLLEEGHCFKNNILNLCNTPTNEKSTSFLLESGHFNTLINLSKEGMGMTLLPYLQSLHLIENDKTYIREFATPAPAREISLIHSKSQLKIHIIEALKNVIDGVIRGVIYFEDVKIISPLKKD